MNDDTRQLRLQLNDAVPRGWSHARRSSPFSRLALRRVASELCVLAGALVIMMALVALRLSLYDAAAVSARVAAIVALVSGVLGVLAFIAAHQLGEERVADDGAVSRR